MMQFVVTQMGAADSRGESAIEGRVVVYAESELEARKNGAIQLQTSVEKVTAEPLNAQAGAANAEIIGYQTPNGVVRGAPPE